jgi:hypothetical protein
LLKVSHQLVIGAANWLMNELAVSPRKERPMGALAANHRRFARGSGAFAPIRGRWASSQQHHHAPVFRVLFCDVVGDFETTVLEWRARLVCPECGSRNVDMMATGIEQ